ncbi:MAG: cation transporter [Sulfuritalea sp.]|nr:cation transporter [Sulfuritalea sp.]
MTCASCALLIEMRLQRDPRVDSAVVNFAAGTVTVTGHLPREGTPPAGRTRKGARGRCAQTADPGRLADGAGDDLRHADAPFAHAAVDRIRRYPAVVFGSGSEIFRKATGRWRSSAGPTWTR